MSQDCHSIGHNSTPRSRPRPSAEAGDDSPERLLKNSFWPHWLKRNGDGGRRRRAEASRRSSTRCAARSARWAGLPRRRSATRWRLWCGATPTPPPRSSAATSRIDALEAEIERRVVEIIGLRAPTETDLREVVAALKIAGVVERIGDYAKNIAKRVPSVEDSQVRPLSLLPEMARIAAEMVHDVLDAFAARDPKKAAAVTRARRRGRRFLQQHLPVAAHPHDGKSAQHHAGDPPAVRRQESGADRRPCHQRRRDGLFRRDRRASRRPAQGRRHDQRSESDDHG